MRKIDPMMKDALLVLRAKAMPLIDALQLIEDGLARLIGDDWDARHAEGFLHNPLMTPEQLWASRPTFELAP